MIGPNCPGCGKPMRLFVVEEAPTKKSGHYECLDCADNGALDQMSHPAVLTSDVGTRNKRRARHTDRTNR